MPLDETLILNVISKAVTDDNSSAVTNDSWGLSKVITLSKKALETKFHERHVYC